MSFLLFVFLWRICFRCSSRYREFGGKKLKHIEGRMFKGKKLVRERDNDMKLECELCTNHP